MGTIYRCETDDPGAIIDAFHEKSFNQLFQDVPDVPELSEWANPHGPDPDEEFDVFNSEFEDVKCDIDRNGDSDTVEADKPLYAGATITLAASMVLVISFAMWHSLTGEALADLLVLLDLHCLTPNLCMKSIKTFMDLFRTFKAPLQFHYYCEQCLLYHGTVKQNFCRNCQTTIKRNSNAYFLVIPIISQLSSLFADGTLLKQIWEYKASQSKKDDGMISDIMDGKLYQERFRKDGYFKGSTSQDLGDLHISLQINTDGVSLFHSSTFSIWPIYFIINELPSHLRFTRSNRIFAGMWFGYSKPDFSTFLKPFAESLHEIYHAGLEVNDQKIRSILLNGVFDSPARCLFMNMVQFNGFHGCPYCYVRGETVQTSERGHTLVYPFAMDSPDGHSLLRTHSSHTRDGEEAERLMNSVNGVKGLTWFSYVPNFDIVRGVAVDYMHCVLLGCMKMLLTLWFDKSHKNEIYSISSKLPEVDRRLLSIKPPSYITRLPRTLADVAHFKAAELKNFLLYYSLPCLFGLLPEDQYHHFSLLVYSIFLLLQEKISTQDLLHCKRMLMEFVINIPVLYSDRQLTSNVHLLLHLTEKVEDLGPLWCSSCFYFEDFNGQLRRLFHGTQHIETQIAFAVSVHQQLPTLAQALKFGSSEQELFKKMMDRNGHCTSEIITDKVAVIGAYSYRELKLEERAALLALVGHYRSVCFFKRLLVHQQVVQCLEYKSTTRRNNAIVRFKEVSFGRVETFVKVNVDGCGDLFVAVVRIMDKDDAVTDHHRSSSTTHMVQLKPPSHLQAILVQDILDVCVCVTLSDNLSFVSTVPNRVERE